LQLNDAGNKWNVGLLLSKQHLYAYPRQDCKGAFSRMSTSTLSIDREVKHNKGDRQSQKEAHTFVLVHGGWCGGWLWRFVAPALQERGHVVTTPTLTGLGERRHLGNGTASLSTHIEDIVAHIEMEDFQDVTLVSQSYGGMVATGAFARIPDRIRSMIYLDAFVPEDGKSFIDCFAPGKQPPSFNACKDEDRSVPPLPLAYLGITDPALVEFMTPKLVDQPWRTLFEPVKVIPRPAHVRMSYVRCTANYAEHLDRIMERLTRDPEVRTATIDTTHLCMLTAPEATVRTILDLEGLGE
jgi:pimeloyl-ACP methyl ester carboxylesterase